MLEKVDWLSFVFGGRIVVFIVKILSKFTQPKIKNWLGKYNANRRKKDEFMRQALEADVDRLSTDNYEELVARLNRISFFILFSLSTVLMIGFFLLLLLDDRRVVEVIGLTGGLVSAIFSVFFMRRLLKIDQLLEMIDNGKKRPRV